MKDLSAERLLEAGASAEAEVAAGGHGGEGLGAPSQSSGEGEAATNYRKRFCSPQLTPDDVLALLQQVLQLTSEQLSSLPLEQQQQVIKIQKILHQLNRHT